MRPKRLDPRSGCSVEVTLSVVGGIWKPTILFHLFTGKKRFMELTRAIPNATQRMLTLQLRELEADGIIVRHVFPQIPPKVEYEISPSGQSLGPLLLSLREWGQHYRNSTQGASQQNHNHGNEVGARPLNSCMVKSRAMGR